MKNMNQKWINENTDKVLVNQHQLLVVKEQFLGQERIVLYKVRNFADEYIFMDTYSIHEWTNIVKIMNNRLEQEDTSIEFLD